MDIDDCAEIVADEWLKSDLDIEVDTVELGLYLAIVYDRKELERWELGDVTSTRVSVNGRKPLRCSKGGTRSSPSSCPPPGSPPRTRRG